VATAPRPGAAKDDAKVFIRLRILDRILDVSAQLTIKEKMAVRLATGLPFEAFLKAGEDTFGEDTLVVLWWEGRRQHGEPNLAFLTAVDEWTTEIAPQITGPADLEMSVVDLNDEEPQESDSPEGSGPA
jgi:hypothetical protein